MIIDAALQTKAVFDLDLTIRGHRITAQLSEIGLGDVQIDGVSIRCRDVQIFAHVGELPRIVLEFRTDDRDKMSADLQQWIRCEAIDTTSFNSLNQYREFKPALFSVLEIRS